MSDVLRIGVVGLGYWGPNLARNLARASGAELRAVCDADPARLRHMVSLYPAVQAHSDYDRMLADSNLDAVVIATPVRFHHPMAKKSLRAGLHTFIEKPMARSVKECDELVELAAEKKRTLMVGHTFLYSSPVRKIKELVDRGELGALRYISSRRLNLGLFQKDINVVWDLAPHDLSIIVHIMGDMPEAVNCQGRANVREGIEDVASLSLFFPKGRFAMVHSSWLDPKKVREMTFVGTEKMILYDDIEAQQKIRIYDQRVIVPPHFDTFDEFQYAYHYGDMLAPCLKQEEPLKVETQHFVDSIRDGKRPLTSGEDGRDLVRILEAASQSLQKQGARVELAG
jgi:predicted dehydrogenase